MIFSNPPVVLSRRLLLAAVFLAAIPFAEAHDAKSGDLQIMHPWSRATVPAAKVAGGYLVVVNSGSQADRLIAASATIVDRTEIHEMAVKDGVMSMRAVEGGLEVPAGGKLALEPGGQGAGYHLMFIGLKAPLKQGEKFNGSLTFERAGVVEVEFAVEAIGFKGEDHSHHGG